MRKPLINLTIVLSFATLLCACNNDKSPWIKLFNGKDLSGFEKRGGEAIYTVEDGAIVGTTVLETENTFLATDTSYDNFILELEFKVDPRLNSGIQFRSNCYTYYKNGRVHGYQAEIDPDSSRKRYWTGGIYDESRRGWLYKLEDNDSARNAFKQGEWNTYRIEAINDTIKTFINGVPASHLIDNMTRSGFIGLQVHSIGKDSSKNGIQVRWKNIRIMTDSAAVVKYSTRNAAPIKIGKILEISDSLVAAGWKPLFDGLSNSGWRGAHADKFPAKGWVINDAILTVLPSDGGESTNGGDIVTECVYKDFELSADFMITRGANSGIKYYVAEKEEKHPGSAFGLEFQILDDTTHPDAKLGRDGNRTIGSLYDLIPASKDKQVKKIGEWNNARIIAKGKQVEHWLNGAKIIEYERGSKAFRAMVAKSKYADAKYNAAGPFGEFEEGHILLQDHGNLVSYKNIMIRELK